MCMNEKESADGHIQTTFKAIALDIQRVDAQAKSVGKHCSANERKHTENKRTEKKIENQVKRALFCCLMTAH